MNIAALFLSLGFFDPKRDDDDEDEEFYPDDRFINICLGILFIALVLFDIVGIVYILTH